MAEKKFGAETQARLAKLSALIDADMRRIGMPAAQRVADPRVGYVPNNRGLTVGANSFFADPEYMPAPAPRVVAVAPAEPAPLRMGLTSDPRLQLPIGALPAAPKVVIPIPRARPAPTSYTVQKGDNPSKIAESLGLTLKQLEERNPGLTKRARRLQIGEKLEV